MSKDNLVVIPQVRINTHKKRHKRIDDALNVMTERLDSKADAIREMLLLAADLILTGEVAEKPSFTTTEPEIALLAESKVESVKKSKPKSLLEMGEIK